MLQINTLSKTYADGTKALNNISMTLPSGMVGLLGPNGAGKSSLMRTIATIQQPDSGSITAFDTNVLAQPNSLRQMLGYLPQEFGSYPNMSCLALLRYFATLKGLDKQSQAKQIPELLALTNLSHVAKKNVSDFSGGMRRRFGIAQALLGDPKILILDEPTAGLDPREQDRFHELLVSISQNKLILLSTHIVEDIENLCHHVALMFKGSLIENNSVAKLIEPLNNKVWQVPANAKLPSDAIVLSKTFKFGVASLRVYSSIKPCDEAVPVQAKLQDRYFFELVKEEQAHDGR